MKKLAIITGAGSGIGQATAIHFNQNNWDTLLVGRTLSTLEVTKKLCFNSKSQISLCACDVGNHENVLSVVAIVKTLQPDQIALVNNAGIYKTHSVDGGGLDTWLSQFQTNLFGAVDLVQNLVPLMGQHSSHSITNVSSTLGLKPTAETSAYSASKAAMINWTLSLALGLGARKIRANCVCPGIVDTPIHPFHQKPALDKAKTLDQLAPLQPLGRIGTAEEIARSIYFLASEQSSWTTGAILSVDGGINIS